MERLQKIIANRGYCSRRKAEELILNKKVKVNGKIIDSLGEKFESNIKIEIENKVINLEKKEYYILNKPRKVISSAKDERGRKTVVDIINTKARIYPIGRLDYDTTGLLLLTNDGDFANKLMHPKNKIVKTYLAKIEGILEIEELYQLKKGLNIDDYFVKPVKVKLKKKNLEKNVSFVEISLIEGKNHIVKNIFATIGHEVIKLKRLSYGPLELGNLKEGGYRSLTAEEIKMLKKN